MGYLNYEFFEAYKELDILCRDIYGESVDKKLGVTLYLEDMGSKGYHGAGKIPGWTQDYNRLRDVRDKRNEIAHSRNSIDIDVCTGEDVDFVRSFKLRILNQTDPLSLYRQTTTSASIKKPIENIPRYTSAEVNISVKMQHNDKKNNPKFPAGCAMGIVVWLFAIIVLLCFLILRL